MAGLQRVEEDDSDLDDGLVLAKDPLCIKKRIPLQLYARMGTLCHVRMVIDLFLNKVSTYIWLLCLRECTVVETF